MTLPSDLSPHVRELAETVLRRLGEGGEHAAIRKQLTKLMTGREVPTKAPHPLVLREAVGRVFPRQAHQMIQNLRKLAVVEQWICSFSYAGLLHIRGSMAGGVDRCFALMRG